MTASAGTAFVDVRPDFTNFNKDVDRNVKGTRSKFSGVGKAAALGLAAGLGGAAVAVKGFVDAAKESEKSNARMQTQLKASGISFKAHAKEIDTVIQRVSKLSGLDDEDLQDSFTNIVRVTGDVNKSLKLTGLAADFARAKHMDVAKAGELVAKVAGGNIGILSRYGIQVDKNATSQEALAELQKKFSGQAEAYGKTSAGAQDRFNVAVENLQETLGQKLLPVLSTVANAAANFINGLQSGGAVSSKLGEIIGTLKDKVQDLAPVFQGIVDTATTLWGTFGTTIKDAFKDTVDFIGKYVSALIEILRGLSDFVSGVLSGDWGRAWDGIKEIFRGAWDAMKALLELAWERIKTVVDLGMKAVIAVIKAAGGLLLDAGKWIIDQIVDGIRSTPAALLGAGSWLVGVLKSAFEKVAANFINRGEDVIGWIVDGLRSVPAALLGAGSWLVEEIKTVFTAASANFINRGGDVIGWIVDGIRSAPAALSNAGSWLVTTLKDAFDGVKDSFINRGSDIIGWIVNGLRSGANLLVNFVNDIIDLINKIPGVNIGHIKGFRAGGTTDDVPAFAQGGVTHHNQLQSGGTITRPMMVVGEEAPRHPEFIIPTNPAYRGRALGLFGQLGDQLGIPGFAIGGIFGKVGDLAGAAFDLVKGGAAAVANLIKLPSVPDNLDWLKGAGTKIIERATAFIGDKLGGLFDGGGNWADGELGVVQRLGAMIKKMDEVNAKHWPYVYGGGHGSFAGPYDCSGLVSAILNAGGFIGSPMTTDGLKGWGEGGDGKYITVGVRGSTGRQAHTMMKLGSKYLESGSGHGAQWVGGWAGRGFPIHRHPAGFAKGGILNEELLSQLVGDDGLGWGLAKGGVVGPFVGSYKLGGVVPRDGMAQVHAGEAILPNGFRPEIQVFIGNEPVDARVDVVMTDRDRRSRQVYRAGSSR